MDGAWNDRNFGYRGHWPPPAVQRFGEGTDRRGKPGWAEPCAIDGAAARHCAVWTYLWRRQYRRGELGGSEPAFRPVAFLTEPAAAVAPQPCAASGRIEILLSNGRRVILSVGVDMEALARLLPVLERA